MTGTPAALIILALAALLLVLLAAFFRNFKTVAGCAAFAFLLSLLTCLLPPPSTKAGLLFVVDNYTLFYLALLNAGGFVVSLLASCGSGSEGKKKIELYPLLVIAALGAGVVVASRHFVSFFLGLETLNISAFALIGFARAEKSLEASFKYLTLAAVSSAFLLFGIALIYSETGSLNLDAVRGLTTLLPLACGTALLLVGVGFKIAAVPFHMWAADVYQGASAPVAGFIATVSKGALFVFALRYLSPAGLNEHTVFASVVTIVAVLSMFAGNLLGLLQNNIKRLLAYSSVSHAGYILAAFAASGALAFQAVGYYLTAYFIALLAAFGTISLVAVNGREPETIDDLAALASQKPLAAATMSAALLSLAGIPLTAGFVGKLYILSAGVASGLWILIFSLVASSIIGLFYYLRVIAAMYRVTGGEAAKLDESRAGHTLLLGLLLLSILIFGVYPGAFISLLPVPIP